MRKTLALKIWVEIQIMILAFFQFLKWMYFSNCNPLCLVCPPPSPHKVGLSGVQLSPSSNET